jgi:polar amino acid transport system substrate-binding protein
MKFLFKQTKPIFFAALLLALLSGCSRQAVGGEPATLQDLNNRVLGLLVSPVVVQPAHIQGMFGFLPSEVQAFPTSNELVTALKTRRVDAMITTVETSKFLISADQGLSIIPGNRQSSDLGMILRASDTDLLNDLNTAIAALKADGTLDRLHARYITDITVDNLAAAPVQVPVMEGAETILAGINGDLPPYDYITVDGKPAGYNVALMSEISRFLGKNVQFVTVPSDARFSALLSSNSRRMDLFFWFYGDLENKNLVLTSAYALVDECILIRK